MFRSSIPFMDAPQNHDQEHDQTDEIGEPSGIPEPSAAT
jgi:hypothetical protein